MSAPHQIVESDADYYASMQPGDMDPEYTTGLIASARATLKRIRACRASLNQK